MWSKFQRTNFSVGNMYVGIFETFQKTKALLEPPERVESSWNGAIASFLPYQAELSGLRVDSYIFVV